MFKPLALFAFGALIAIAGAWLRPVEANAQASLAQSGPLSTRPAPGRGERDMVSWVVLSNTHVELDVESLRGKLDELYPGEFLPARQKGNFVVEGSVPGQFLIQSSIRGAAGTFFLHSVPGPYTEFSNFAKSLEDRSLRQTAEAQCCWLSVDLIARHTSDGDAYRFIGRLLAKLAPADAALLVHPTRRIAMSFTDEVRRRLASGEQIP